MVMVMLMRMVAVVGSVVAVVVVGLTIAAVNGGERWCVGSGGLQCSSYRHW